MSSRTRRNPSVQTVNVAEAIADRSGPDAVVAALGELAGPIAEANAVLDELYDRRTALWAVGLELGLSKVALGKASGVSDTMVSTRVAAAKAQAKAG